jgi:serine/threonine-protein kinase HipA
VQSVTGLARKLDRRLQRAGIDYHLLTALDRLSAVEKNGLGALAYIPELPDEKKLADNMDWGSSSRESWR